MEGQIKSFPDKVKLKFTITKPLLYEMLKGLIYKKEDKKYEHCWQQTHNNQQPNLKNQKQKQTKWSTRTGIESQKWKSYGGLSEGKGLGKMG